MLEAARALKADGVDVVVGYVETHGRAETEALLEASRSCLLRMVAYRGTTLREFDLDAALARRPGGDPRRRLAHTNAPRLPAPSGGRTCSSCSTPVSPCTPR
jgi:two-component system sensor histidine kinase KdpD